MAAWVFLIDVLHHGVSKADLSLMEAIPLQAVYVDHSRNPRLLYGVGHEYMAVDSKSSSVLDVDFI